MRWFLTISTLFIIQHTALSQKPSSFTLETDVFTINFPAIPSFTCDTLQDSALVVKHSYSLEDENGLMYSIVYRDRTKEDNKHHTFKNEIQWMDYWTLAEISEKKKGQLEGNPTLHFIAKSTEREIHFWYILTKKHFIRIGVSSREESVTDAAQQFFDSFKLKL
ncbi:MAG: hypothetical protein NXI10_09370 [bacterium]|nr:hypothetical protein [bacterium]